MEEIVLYEYLIDSKKMAIYKNVCVAENIERDTYRARIYRDDKFLDRRFIFAGNIDVVKSARIVSQEDDYDKFSKILIDDLEHRINMTREKLEKQEELLRTLKGV